MSKSKSEIIVSKIISDIKGRKGIGDEFEQIDDDIQSEIKSCWVEIVDQILLSDGQATSN